MLPWGEKTAWYFAKLITKCFNKLLRKQIISWGNGFLGFSSVFPALFPGEVTGERCLLASPDETCADAVVMGCECLSATLLS